MKGVISYMLISDSPSIQFPAYRGNHGREASMTEAYINQHPSLLAACREVFRTSGELIETYKVILTESEVCKAKMLCWGCRSGEDYAHKFLVLVLMDYKVWQISDTELKKRYDFIAKHNNAWAKRFLKDYETKLKRCKVSFREDTKIS